MTSFRRMPVLAGLLCLLLMGFTAASYGSVRFDVVPSPTEVINTGRSEVLGSLNLVVRDNTGVTGTATGGYAQIGIIYTNPIPVQIDNGTSTGIRLFYTTGFGPAFAPAGTGIIGVTNIDLNGKCVGYITINMAPYAIPLAANPLLAGNPDFIRIDGVRGRIDNTGQPPGMNLNAQMQSINDPAANQFFPDTVRVATIFDGMHIRVNAMNLLLCFPTSGFVPGGVATNYIRITESFARAFVDDNDDPGGLGTDRVDSGSQIFPPVFTPPGTPGVSQALGAPTNQTRFYVYMDSIPASVSGIVWQASVTNATTLARLDLISTAYDATAGTASAIYAFNSVNQTQASDTVIEVFDLVPAVVLKTGNQTATGVVNVGVTLGPHVGDLTTCASPSNDNTLTLMRPRFLYMIESDNVALGNPPSDPTLPYAYIIRCNCFMLFTYVTSDASYDTGIAVANTTGDTAPFGTSVEAPDQIGKITFYFYQRDGGYKGSYTTTADTLSGYTYVNLVSAMLGSVSPTPLTTFSGYIIAKAEFQFCHALAFISDTKWNSWAHGYQASIIPDPAIRNVGGRRAAVNAGDVALIVAGESLDN